MGQLLIYFFWIGVSFILFNSLKGGGGNSKKKADQAKKDEARMKEHVDSEGGLPKFIVIVIWVGLAIGVFLMLLRG